MTEYPKLKLAYVTQPAPGLYLFNLLDERENFERLELTREQLSNIVCDGAEMILRHARAE